MPEAVGTEAKVAFLLRPESYAEGTGRVDVVETHMSWVFLTDRHAYKLKKPVRYEGLDFRTPELRRLSCTEEVRLNRRLARDVYLGVVALARDAAGGLALGGAGAPVDWLVRMRRLPADGMLDRRIERGGLREGDVGPAARLLAGFFARARPVEVAAESYRTHLREGIRGDRRELCRPEYGLPVASVSALAEAGLACLDGQPTLFDGRVREGRIVEGHGDLRAEHVCLAPEPAIIDCLEFSRELRILDPADELAFLGLDCERLGNPEVGGWFLAVYSELARDEPPEALRRFYRIYRGLRRAKIALWHLREPEVRDPEHWRACARRYLELAQGPCD